MPTTLHENRPSAGIGVVEVQKPVFFFAISAVLARPSAGIGVVEVQKPMVFLRFLKFPRDPLRGSAWSRCKNPWFFRFPTCPHDPLRGSAWSRCKNPWFFAISNMPARPSAGMGVVEVQKPMVFLRYLRCPRSPLREVQKLKVFCDFCGARATEVQKLEVFCVFCCPRELSRGSRACSRASGSRVRFLPGPRAGVARCNLHFKATCAEQLAQSNLCRPTCADQFAQSALPRATCEEQLAQSNLHRPAERLA